MKAVCVWCGVCVCVVMDVLVCEWFHVHPVAAESVSFIVVALSYGAA